MVTLRDIGPDVFRLHGEERYAEALAVVEGAIGELPPDDLPTATFWHICLLNRTGKPDAAIAGLRSALARGWWWSESMLRDDEDLATLQGHPEFEELVAESLRRAQAAAGEHAHGEHALAGDEPPAGSFVALHAAGGRVGHTMDVWRPVVSLRYDLHVPGSSQRISHDRASWTDHVLARSEIVAQVQQATRTERVVAVGRSQGAVIAAELASHRDLPVAGLVLVALAPRVEEAPDVDVPTFLLSGAQDRPEYLDRIDAFAAHHEKRGIPVCSVRLVGMDHLYPEPFTPHLEAALRWLEDPR